MNPATDWIDQARGLLDVLKQNLSAPADGADGGHGSDCRWCPLCQSAAIVRGERPEVTAALADVLTATATALRSFAEADRPAAEPEPADHQAENAGDPPPVVQRIEIA
jgi:hypothetical protein